MLMIVVHVNRRAFVLRMLTSLIVYNRREENEAQATRTGQRRGYRLIAHRGFTLVRMHFYRLRRWVSEVCLFLSFAVEEAKRESERNPYDILRSSLCAYF